MPDVPQIIHLHINLGAGSRPALARSGGVDELEIGKGTFRVYQGPSLDKLCAYIRSEGITADEQWIWISGTTNNASPGEAARIYSEPGSVNSVRLKFDKYAFDPLHPDDLPLPADWRAAVKAEVNPDPLQPHFALIGVELTSTTFVP